MPWVYLSVRQSGTEGVGFEINFELRQCLRRTTKTEGLANHNCRCTFATVRLEMFNAELNRMIV